jgi:hypothetical protein
VARVGALELLVVEDRVETGGARQLEAELDDHVPHRAMDAPDLEKIATEDSHSFPGKTLVVTSRDSLFPVLDRIRRVLHEGAPDLASNSEKARKRKKELLKMLDQAKEESSKPKEKIDPIEQRLRIMRIEEEMTTLDRVVWPDRFIVNTPDHARRFGRPPPRTPAVMPILSDEYEDSFPEFMYSLLLSGIGVYDFSQCTEHQRRLVMKVVKQLSFLFAGKEIVFGTNIEGLTHLFIDKEFGDTASRNVLFQLIGRAGRVGQSYEALIVMNSDAILRNIMSFENTIDEDAAYFEAVFSPLIR